MIQKHIKEIYKDQANDYVDRLDLLNSTFEKEIVQDIDKKRYLTITQVKQVNETALGLEGEENNASFEIGMIRGLQQLRVDMKADIRKYIDKIKKQGNPSEDFVLGMVEIFRLIK